MARCVCHRRWPTGGTTEAFQAAAASGTNAGGMAESLSTHCVSLILLNVSLIAILSYIFFEFPFFNRQVITAPFVRRPQITHYSSDGDSDEE